ncbi:hypothetical protein BgiBS90_021428, partial [Biomphalaria glabrata]
MDCAKLFWDTHCPWREHFRDLVSTLGQHICQHSVYSDLCGGPGVTLPRDIVFQAFRLRQQTTNNGSVTPSSGVLLIYIKRIEIYLTL